MHHSTVQRLAFVKFLYATGNKQAQGVAPLSSAGLLVLHDAMELFLDLACEHLGVTEKARDFKDYWSLINAKLEAQGKAKLSQQAPAMRLNKGRVSLKHYGGHPAKMDLEAYRNTVKEFFTDNCCLIFDVSLDSISMVEFVEPETARQKVEAAIQCHEEGRFDEAANELILGFEMMRYHYIDGVSGDHADRVMLFGPSLAFAEAQLRGLDGVEGRNVRRTLIDTVRSVEKLKSAMQMLALGIDLRRYTRFRSSMPICMRMAGGNFVLQHMKKILRDSQTSQYCIDFVIDAAIQMGDFDNRS